MQHTRTNHIPLIRIHALQNPPPKPRRNPQRILMRNAPPLLHQPHHPLRLPRRAPNLPPPLEEVLSGQVSRIHVLVYNDGQLQRQRLQRAGEVGDADGRGFRKDGLGFEHGGLHGLGVGGDGGVGELLGVDFQVGRRRVV